MVVDDRCPDGRDEAGPRRLDVIVALLLATFSGLILFGLIADWPSHTHDAVAHFPRIEALADALRAGLILPRWFPDLMFGYGDPTLNYYSPGFYYPAALLHLGGLDLVASIRLTLSIGFAVSAWWMFRLARLFVSLLPAIVGVICFQFFPYRIYDLFVRGAFPEFSAFIWLPLIALCTLQAIRAGRKASWASSYPLALAKAGLAWAALIVTHNLTMLMAALVLGAAFALYAVIERSTRASLIRTLVSCLVPLAIGILLSAWYIVPAFLELDWVLAGHGLSTGLIQTYLMTWRELVNFDLFYSYIYPTHRPSLPVYVIPIALAALLGAWKMRQRNLRILMLVSLLMTLGVVWMMVDASAWFWIRGEALLEHIRFPWRWQMFAALGVALLLAASLESLRNAGRAPAFVVPLLSVLISVYLFASASVRLDYETIEETPYIDIWTSSWEGWLWHRENSPWGRDFLPIWTDRKIDEAANAGRQPWEHAPNLDAIGSASVAPTRAGLLQQRFLVSTEKTFRLLFHQFYFPPWRVAIDGVQADAQRATGLALMSVEIPPGTHTVELAWGPTRAVWLGRILTTLGWVVVFALMFWASRVAGTKRDQLDSVHSRFRRLWPLVGWVAFGSFMLVAASGITARTWDSAPIGADYGKIRLEGVRSMPPVRAGEVAPVHLTWFVKGAGEPVSAFVHLVDETGMGVSQHDGPPGGLHSTYQRWSPGLLLRSTHNITIPDSLPPGRYRLIAGLYYPDQSPEPLLPLNGDSPRLEIGTLDVLP